MVIKVQSFSCRRVLVSRFIHHKKIIGVGISAMLFFTCAPSLAALPVDTTLTNLTTYTSEQIKGQKACSITAAHAMSPSGTSPDIVKAAIDCSNKADRNTCLETLEFLTREISKTDANFIAGKNALRCRLN